MKRLLIFAALVLGLASCQREPEGLDINVGGEQETVVTVNLPQMSTRAGGTDSATTDIEAILATSDYTMRYMLQVFYGDKPSALYVRYSDDQSVSFPVRLVPGQDRDYNFVVWADIVAESATLEDDVKCDDLHYAIGADLREISVIDNKWVAMDETRDAFTAVKLVENYNGSQVINIPLYRPFAKLRVITTDMVELTKHDIIPTTAVVTYKTKHRVAYNALTGEAAAASATKEHSYTIAAYGDNTETDRVLFTDYFFADDEVVKFEMLVKDQDDKEIVTRSFNTDIFVKRNYLTTLKGDILTNGTDVNVTVKPDMGGNHDYEVKYVNSASGLQDAIDEIPAGGSGSITLEGDIDLGDLFAGLLSTRATVPDYCIEIPANVDITLNLNGKNVTTSYQQGSDSKHMYAFKNNGLLTITDSSAEGNGKVKSRGIYNYGKLTLDGGTINACDGNGGYGVRNYDGATFVMNGGSIVTSLEDDNKVDDGGYDATTLRVDEGATATINGGTINNICDYTFAIDNHGTTTVKGGTITSVHSTVANYGTMTINGGSFTCNGLEGITAHALWAAAGTTTINGGTFDGKDNYNGFNVDASEDAIVNINGGKFLPVHSGSLYGEGTINVMGGEFFDDPYARVADGYVATKQENGFWAVKKMTEEAKLRKVLAEGGEVTLEEDITIAAQLEVTTTEAIVVNGNNKTINYTGSSRAFNVNGLDTADVTLNNLTFVNTASYCQRGINFNVAGKLTLNNVTVGKTGTPATYAINLPGSSVNAEVVINNSYFRGNIALNVWGENAKIKATGSEFVSYDGAEHENYAAISLNNDGSTIANGTTIDIDGGKVIALNEKSEPSIAVRNSTMTGKVTISDSTEVVGTVANPVAAVIYEGYNEFYTFTTLEAAIDKAIETKGSVRLIKDIEVDETITIPAAEGVTVTLDLNGMTITGTMHKSVGAVVKNEGTLTVKNGTIKSTAGNGGSAILNYGTIVVEGVTLNGAQFDGEGWPSYAINNYGNLTVNSAIINTYHGAIATGDNGVSVINDATVDVGQSSQTKQTSWALYVFENGQLTVNGGTFKNTKDEKNQVYGGGYICATSTKETVINGGTFDKTEGDQNGNGIYYKCTNLIIKGGTFDTDPSKHISEGYVAVKNENGTWTVTNE